MRPGGCRGEARLHPPLLADLLVYLDTDQATARERKARLDQLAGRAYTSDALTFTGSPADLADLMSDWQQAGLAGLRLRPAAIPHDLDQITAHLVPELRRRGRLRAGQRIGTLRERLGLARSASPYVAA